MKDLDRNKRYTLLRTTIEQRKEIFEWLLKNDVHWNIRGFLSEENKLYFHGNEWHLEDFNKHTCATELFE